MQTEVKILVQTITAQYGALSEGDILRTSAEFAKHLVEDCNAAVYTKGTQKVTAPAPAAEQPVTEQPAEPVVDPVVDPVADPVEPAAPVTEQPARKKK